MAGMAVNQHVGGANGQPSSSNHSKNKRFSIGGWSPPNCCLTISNQLVNFLRTCFCCCCCCCGCVDRSHYKNHQPRTKHHHHHQRRPSFNRDRRLSFPELNCSTSAAEPSLTSSPRLSNLKEQDSRNNPDTQNANNNELIGLSNSSGDECGNHLNHHHHHHHRRRRSFKNNIVSRLLFGLLPNRKQQQQQQNSRISVAVLSPAIVCCDVEQNIQTTISAQDNQQTSSSSSSSRLMQLSASSSLANNNYKNNDGDNFHCDLIPRNNLNSNNGNYNTHKTFELLESTTNTKGSPLDCQNVNKEEEKEDEEEEEEEDDDDDDDDDDVEEDKDVGDYRQSPRLSSYHSFQSMPSCSGLQIVDPNIHHQQQQPCGSSPPSSKAAGTPKKSAKLSLSSLMAKSTFGSKSKSMIQPQQSPPHPTIPPPSTSIKASTSSFGIVNEQQHKLRMDVSSKRLMKEIGDLMRRQQNRSLNANFSVELIDDSLYEWDIKIYEFDKESQIYLDMQQYQIPYVQLHAMFPETYPFDPPFIRVVAPYIERGYVMEGGAICLELLTKTGWTSAYTMESVIIQLMASFVKGQAIIKATKDVSKCFTKKSAVNSFRHIVRIHDKHGWVDTPLYEG